MGHAFRSLYQSMVFGDSTALSDVESSSNLSRAACQRPVDLHSPRRGVGVQISQDQRTTPRYFGSAVNQEQCQTGRVRIAPGL